MSRDFTNKMERLDIDPKIRPLIAQMWQHGYKTLHSCSGKSREKPGYVTFFRNSGDGWFESVASELGWRTSERGVCCYATATEDILKYKQGNFMNWARYCTKCGNGLGDIVSYRKIKPKAF